MEQTFKQGDRISGVWESDEQEHYGTVTRHGGWDGTKELVHVEWDNGKCSQEPAYMLNHTPYVA